MLAQPNPILYFNTIELLCRARSWDAWSTPAALALAGVYVLLHPPNSGPEDDLQLLQRLVSQADTEQHHHHQQQQQQEGWQLCKAALSAYASWTKAYTKLLEAYAQTLRNTPRAAAADSYLDLLMDEPTLLPWVARSSSLPAANGNQLQLLLLLWRARMVVATAEHLGLRATAAPAAAAVAGRSGGCSRSSSRSEGGNRGSSSSSGGGNGGASASLGSSSSSSGASSGGNSGSSSRSSDSTCEELQVMKGAVMSRDTGLSILRSYYNAVQLWHKSTAAACMPNAEAAGRGAAVNDDLGLRDDADMNLSQRLLHLPSSLPSAVVAQLEHISSTYPEEMLAGKQQPAGVNQQQLQLLQDMLRVSQLLLAEVPCTLGCANPECVELRGSSEVKVSSKACTACKVVCYCSKACQVAHWKGHRVLCKKLSH